MSVRLAEVGNWRSGGTPPKDREELWGGGFPWMSTRDLKQPELSVSTDTITEGAARQHSTVVRAGSLLIGTRGMALARRLPVAMVTRAVAFNQDIKAIEPHEDVCSKYLLYALLAFERPILGLTEEAAHGTKRLDSNLLRAFRIPCPPRSEQERIADFLDAEIARIDALVIARGRQLALLRERRRARLDQLVAGAERIAARRLFTRIDQGWSAIADETPATDGGEVGVLRLNAVDAGQFFPERNKRLDASALRDDWRRYLVGDGDLLVSRASGSLGRVGESALARVAADGPTLLFPDILYRMTPGPRILAEFAALVMRSSHVRSQIREVARGTANNKIRASDLRDLLLPVPDLVKQGRTVGLWAADEDRQRDLERILTRQINLLRERRQALITAAVTGGLQVPVAPAANAAE